jgi:hypothetical protein
MTTPSDPVPVEIQERILAAREAVTAAVNKDSKVDYAAWLREVVAAERELADAYEAAYKVVPLPFQTLHYALLDAYHALRARATGDEREARATERKRAAAKGQA